jgi:hypothetical protein
MKKLMFLLILAFAAELTPKLQAQTTTCTWLDGVTVQCCNEYACSTCRVSPTGHVKCSDIARGYTSLRHNLQFPPLTVTTRKHFAVDSLSAQ